MLHVENPLLISRLMNRFLTYCSKVRRMSPATIATYAQCLQSLSDDCKCDLTSLSTSDIADHIMCLSERGLQPSSINTHLACLRSYYDYMCRFHGLSFNPALPIRNLRTARPLPQFIEQNKMAAIIDRLPADSFKSMRSRLLVVVLYYCGLRSSEVCSLRVSDVNLDSRYMIIHGKGSKDRYVPFVPFVADEMRRYLAYCRIFFSCDKEFLFLTSDGAPFQTHHVRWSILYALKPFVPRALCHPHCLRHSFATALINNGASLLSISRLLGHSSVATTEIYTHVNYTDIKNQYEQVFCKIQQRRDVRR